MKIYEDDDLDYCGDEYDDDCDVFYEDDEDDYCDESDDEDENLGTPGFASQTARV